MRKENTIIYIPNQKRNINMFKSWFIMIKNIIIYKELIVQLFKRNFFAVYKKTYIGSIWIFISPVIGIISWVFMNMTGILKPGDVGVPYPVYILLGSSIWGLFMGFFSSSTATIQSGSALIIQVKFPHEILLFTQIAQQLANFILSFTFIIIVLLFFKIIPGWLIIFFPISILPLFFLSCGIGLVISVIKIVAPDIAKGFTLVFGYLMYITPVIYSPKPENILLQKVIKWNPLTYLIGLPRDIILYKQLHFDYFSKYLYSFLFAFIIFLIGWRIFFLTEDKVIEKVL